MAQLGNNERSKLLWVGEVWILLHDCMHHVSREDVAEVAVGLVLVLWDGVVALLRVKWMPMGECLVWHWRGVPGRAPNLFHLLRHTSHHDTLAARHETAGQSIATTIAVGLFIATRKRVPAGMLLTTERWAPLSLWVALV